MLLRRPQVLTTIPIWFPKYATDSGEYEVWPLVSKVDYASSVILIEFTKAKHLIGQRFCIRREDVERCPRGTNGKVPIYRIPFKSLKRWDTPEDIKLAVALLFDH